MRLGIIAPGYGSVIRGAENVVNELSKRLSNSKDIQVDILSGHANGIFPGHDQPTLRVITFPMIERGWLPQNPFPLGEISGWIEAMSLSFSSFKKVAKEKYDIVILIQFMNILPSLLAKRANNSKIIYQMHCVPSSKVKPFVLSTRHVDSVVSVSNLVAEALMEVVGVESTVIHNGVDIQRFSPWVDGTPIRETILLMCGVSEPACIVTYMGALLRKKGIYTLMQAFCSLPKNCILQIVGSGPELNKLSSYAKHLGVEKRVFICGFVDDRSIPSHYTASDIVVVPSEYREAFPLVPLEAMSSGKPIVVSDAGGMVEAVEDCKTGFIAKAGDDKDLSDKILQLAFDPKLRKQMGKAARAKVVKEFDWKVICEKYLNLFDELLVT